MVRRKREKRPGTLLTDRRLSELSDLSATMGDTSVHQLLGISICSDLRISTMLQKTADCEEIAWYYCEPPDWLITEQERKTSWRKLFLPPSDACALRSPITDVSSALGVVESAGSGGRCAGCWMDLRYRSAVGDLCPPRPSDSVALSLPPLMFNSALITLHPVAQGLRSGSVAV